MFFSRNISGIVWALMVAFLTLLPGDQFGENAHVQGLDKAIHGFFYGQLMLMLAYGFIRQYSFPTLRYHPVKSSSIISFLYGMALETMQSFVKTRSFDSMDLVANGVGIVFAALFFVFVVRGNPSGSTTDLK